MSGLVPVQDTHAGREAFARDLDLCLRNGTLADRGWAKPDDLTLLVPLFAERPEGQRDLYLLRLFFDHYSNAPPSAQFINPLTLSYSFPQDAMWIPLIENHPAIHFHTNYSGAGQLVCSSTTLEFYKVNHSVDERHVWRPGAMNFTTTIAAIKSGLAPIYYRRRAIQ